jgi:predicted signal transduction protein with EAL and GGDEF domain
MEIPNEQAGREAFTRLQEWLDGAQDDYWSVLLVDLDRMHEYPEPTQIRLEREVHGFLESFRAESIRPLYAGRDEFIVALPGYSTEEALRTARSILADLATNFSTDGLTASAGVAGGNPSSVSVSELWRKAEEALNLAKRRGRNRAESADSKMILRSGYYTAAQIERLREYARSQGRKESDIMRASLDEYLDRHCD